MKFLSNLKIIVSVVILAFFGSSCNKEEENNDANSILNIALNNPDLTTFVDALLISNFTETLKNSEPYTVFAPSNDAFKAFLTTTGYNTLERVPASLLQQILLNHIVLGNVKSTDLTTGYIKTLAKSSRSENNTMSMYVDATSGVKLNGVSKVITPDISASNGTIHIVDAIIDLPFVLTHAKLNPKLTSLVSTINTNAETSLINRLTIADFIKDGKTKFLDPINPITIFAPTNDAFTALNTELAPSGGIAAVSKENLNKILKYHAVEDYIVGGKTKTGNVLAASLTEGQKLPTLHTITTKDPVTNADVITKVELTIELSGGAKVKDQKNRISTIQVTDIQCWNGVIHLVDKVFLPNL